ncbi:MAG: Abi family protein [Christensenellales bacterium]
MYHTVDGRYIHSIKYGMYYALYGSIANSEKSQHNVLALFTYHMAKPFKTYDEQIAILKSRGLFFSDENAAIRFLETENYYNVINGYKEPFLQKNSEQYIADTQFEHIQLLYQLDKALRHSILSSLLDIENTLKSIIAYEFAKEYGECAYLDLSSYNAYNQASTKEAMNLIASIKKEISLCKKNLDHSNDNIRHYLNVHGEIPIWVLFSHMMLGDLSRFYQCLSPQLKSKICIHLKQIYGKQFSSKDLYAFFRILNNVRNLCAHNNRIYNYRTVYKISPVNPFVNSLIKKYGKNFRYNNIISVVIIIWHLTSNNEFKKFFENFLPELQALIKTPPHIRLAISAQQNYTFLNFIEILLDATKSEIK